MMTITTSISTRVKPSAAFGVLRMANRTGSELLGPVLTGDANGYRGHRHHRGVRQRHADAEVEAAEPAVGGEQVHQIAADLLHPRPLERVGGLTARSRLGHP